jgi:hypothetical protein
LEKKTKKQNRNPSKAHVIQTMEIEANQEQEKVYNLNENDVLLVGFLLLTFFSTVLLIVLLSLRFCIYMIEKHGEDYVKMTRDHKNYYQETPKQIKRRINQFKNMNKAYEKYLLDKQNGVDFLAKLDEKF